jgi:serine protease AprX
MIQNTFALLFCLLIVATTVAQTDAWREKLSPEVKNALDNHQNIDILVTMTEKADISAAKNIKTKNAKAQFVFSKLKETALHSQANLSRILHEKNAFANSFYIVNAVSVQKCTPDLVALIAKLPEVSTLANDPWTYFDGLVPSESLVQQNFSSERNTIEWGIEKINAPAVWALGYNGQGITVGGADTGYDWGHPALKPHYRGFDVANSSSNHTYNWHDGIHEQSPLNNDSLNPCGFNALQPCDDNSHGTHTAGTMIGDDGQGNQIGVAPGAKWIGCRNMERGWGRPSSYVECFEWFLAPTDLDNANPDVTKAPHVINNSWYCAVSEGCSEPAINELLRTAIINLKASGVVVVISNGNDGFGTACETTVNPPAYFTQSFGVGATDINDALAGFSSQGPIFDQGVWVNKPQVSAPGVNVRSSTPNGNYSNYSGTSMAGPHVVGLVALVLSARPDLAGDVEKIEEIVQNSAFFIPDSIDCNNSLGNVRPNHSYGWGRVNALLAVNMALSEPVLTMEPNELAFDIRLVENPVKDALVFEVKNLGKASLLEIFSAEGRLIKTFKLNATQQELVRFSTGNWANGVYFWKINEVSGKFVFAQGRY